MKLYLVIIALAISLPSFSISAKTNSKIKPPNISFQVSNFHQCLFNEMGKLFNGLSDAQVAQLKSSLTQLLP